MSIRPATEADQPIISSLIRGARLNPRNLHWQRFLIAEDNGSIVGLRQVKVHNGGTREVASGLSPPFYPPLHSSQSAHHPDETGGKVSSTPL